VSKLTWQKVAWSPLKSALSRRRSAPSSNACFSGPKPVHDPFIRFLQCIRKPDTQTTLIANSAAIGRTYAMRPKNRERIGNCVSASQQFLCGKQLRKIQFVFSYYARWQSGTARILAAARRCCSSWSISPARCLLVSYTEVRCCGLTLGQTDGRTDR